MYKLGNYIALQCIKKVKFSPARVEKKCFLASLFYACVSGLVCEVLCETKDQA